jgi:hypothetical protein
VQAAKRGQKARAKAAEAKQEKDGPTHGASVQESLSKKFAEEKAAAEKAAEEKAAAEKAAEEAAELDKAASKLQAAKRGQKGRQRAKEEKAATKLQAAKRGKDGRDKVSALKAGTAGEESAEEPAEEAISAMLSSGGRLGVGWSLTRAGVSTGAWLVARKIAGAGTIFRAHRPPRASCSTCTPLTPQFLHLQVHPFRAAAAVAWTWPP